MHFARGLAQSSGSVDGLLNLLAWGALRLTTPLRAVAIVKRVARLFPAVVTTAEVESIAVRLGNQGTCLSRAIAVASRCARSEIVIGVSPDSSDARAAIDSVDAHAWVEIDGVQILGGSYTEIARFRGD
jgi:hypothetical protein